MEPAAPDVQGWTNFTDYSFSYYYYDLDPAMEEAYRWSDVINGVSTRGVIPFGLLTNLTFLFVVVRVRAMHTPVNVHLANLAAADVLFLLVMVFQYATRTATLATGILGYLPYVASTLFVTAMAAGRCFAIHRPFRARTGPTARRAAAAAAGVWAASLLASVAYNVAVRVPGADPLAVNLLHLLVNPVFLVVNAALYAGVVCGLLRHRRQGRVRAPSALSQRRLVVMLVTNTAVFFAFHLAATCFNLYALLRPVPPASALKAHAFIFLLSFLNASVNPLVYTATNAEYRAAFLSAFRSPCCRRRRRRRGRSRRNPRSCGCLSFGGSKQPASYIEIRERARAASNSNGPANGRSAHPNSVITEVSESGT